MKYRSFQNNYNTGWVKVAKNFFDMHTEGWAALKPYVDRSKCTGCGMCQLVCPTGCIKEEQDLYIIEIAYCKGCGLCAHECPAKAISMI